MMEEALKKIAGTTLLAILLHVVFASVGSDFNLATVYWLLYTVTCGVINNYSDNVHHRDLFLLSLASPMALIAITYYRALFYGTPNCWLSGISCQLDGSFFAKSMAFLCATICFVWLCSYLSSWILESVKTTFDMSEERAKLIKSRIVWIGSIITALVGVVLVLAHGWNPL